MNPVTELTPVDVKQIFELAYIAWVEGELQDETLPLLRQLRDAYSEIWKDYTRIDLGDGPPITELTPVDVKQIFELAYIAFDEGELMDSTLPLLRQLRDVYPEVWKDYKHIDLGDEPKTTVYLVTRGQYSEYVVCAGYSTRQLAEAALEGFSYNHNEARVEEHILDTEMLPKGLCWEIWMGGRRKCRNPWPGGIRQ